MKEILPHPFGLTILGDYLYWTDWQEHTVERAEKVSGKDRRVLISHLEGLMSLQAVAIRPDQVNKNNTIGRGMLDTLFDIIVATK